MMRTYKAIEDYLQSVSNTAVHQNNINLSINPDLKAIFRSVISACSNAIYGNMKTIQATISDPITYALQRGLTPYEPQKATGNGIFNADSTGITITSDDNITFESNGGIYDMESGQSATSSEYEYNIQSITRDNAGRVTIDLSTGVSGLTIGTVITIAGVSNSSFDGDFSIEDFGDSDASQIIVISDSTSVATSSGGTLSAITITIPFVPKDIGVVTNREVGTLVTFQSIVTGIEESGYVALGGISGGRNAETRAEFSQRCSASLETIQTPINAAWYEGLAINGVPGLTRAWMIQDESGLQYIKWRFYHMRDGNEDPYPTLSQNIEVRDFFTSLTDSNDTKFNLGVDPARIDFLTPGKIEYTIDLTYLPIYLRADNIRSAIIDDVNTLLKEQSVSGSQGIPSDTAIKNTVLQTLIRIDRNLQTGNALDLISAGINVTSDTTGAEDIMISSLQEVIFPS